MADIVRTPGSIQTPLTAPPVRQTAPPPPPPPLSTLRIVDNFRAAEEPKPGENWVPPHGSRVMAAAMGTGFRGSITPEQSTGDPRAADLGIQQLRFLGTPGMPPEMALGALDTFTRLQSADLLNTSAQILNQDHDRGARGSVVNFSQDGSAANSTAAVYDRLRLGWTQAPPGESEYQQYLRAQGTGMMNNLANAWGINPSHLTDPDPKVHGPARAQMQQNLIDRMDRANRDPQLERMRQGFSQAVDRYEARGNSVVVAAGNQGDLLDFMRQDNGGRPLRASDSFMQNPLSVPSALTVGATEVGPGPFGPQQRIAPYTTRQGTDFYTNGNTVGTPGTSFAAPRAAALLYELQRANPNMSSNQLDRLVAQSMSGGNGNLEQPGAIEEFMASRRW